MKSANYGIAVLENVFSENMNVNVAVEYGYVQGLGKRALLLKDKRFTKIAVDLLGKLWKEFDIDHLETVKKCVENWMVDLKKAKIVGN